MQSGSVKVKDVRGSGGAFRRYRDLYYGDSSLGFVLKAELATTFCGQFPGPLGIWLRSRCYRGLFRRAGRPVLVGNTVTLRHPRKISLGDGAIVDDNCVLDAKGRDNEGITIGNNVFIGRNTIVYCKNGNIRIEDDVNISANCTIFSSNSLTIRAGTMIGAYSYLLSGGEYDYADATPFAEQSGLMSKGELVVGRNCWLGARVTVLDGASIGEHCVIGAGAVVNRPVPRDSLAVGVPARTVKSL